MSHVFVVKSPCVDCPCVKCRAGGGICENWKVWFNETWDASCQVITDGAGVDLEKHRREHINEWHR